VRVRTDVAAVPKLFDYAVPEHWPHSVVVGSRVRVELHGRRVGAWVVDDHVKPDLDRTLLPLAHWSGWGPPPALIDLAEWAAWRWAGPESYFLTVASPVAPVKALPRPSHAHPGIQPDQAAAVLVAEALDAPGVPILRLPPKTDILDTVLAVIEHAKDDDTGSVLVLVPSNGWAERLTQRLTRRGLAATTDWAAARAGWPVVVGSRGAAWAPVPRVRAALVIDAHDEAYREERSPTYSAVDVVLERTTRDGAPCLLLSPIPTATLRHGRTVIAPDRTKEGEGWAPIQVVDRRGADPHTGLFSEEFVQLARQALDRSGIDPTAGPLVCVFNRVGGARLLACAHCGEVAQCTRCAAAVRKVDESLVCPKCGQERPMVCAACGKLRFKTLRAGVSRLREELAALLGTEVAEVSGQTVASGEPPTAPVLIGTEAVLHRARRAAAVAFLDIDLHLLAPRVSATDETLALLVRASRLVGPRHRDGSARVLVQSRVPDHPVLRAAVTGDPAAVDQEEDAMRQSVGLPPYSALALISGPLAPAYVDELRLAAPEAVNITPFPDDRFLISAPDHAALCDLLAAVARPAGRGLRIEVDPTSF
jgi:primosomal protein N' (replication factor Y)